MMNLTFDVLKQRGRGGTGVLAQGHGGSVIQRFECVLMKQIELKHTGYRRCIVESEAHQLYLRAHAEMDG